MEQNCNRNQLGRRKVEACIAAKLAVYQKQQQEQLYVPTLPIMMNSAKVDCKDNESIRPNNSSVMSSTPPFSTPSTSVSTDESLANNCDSDHNKLIVFNAKEGDKENDDINSIGNTGEKTKFTKSQNSAPELFCSSAATYQPSCFIVIRTTKEVNNKKKQTRTPDNLQYTEH